MISEGATSLVSQRGKMTQTYSELYAVGCALGNTLFLPPVVVAPGGKVMLGVVDDFDEMLSNRRSEQSRRKPFTSDSIPLHDSPKNSPSEGCEKPIGSPGSCKSTAGKNTGTTTSTRTVTTKAENPKEVSSEGCEKPIGSPGSCKSTTGKNTGTATSTCAVTTKAENPKEVSSNTVENVSHDENHRSDTKNNLSTTTKENVDWNPLFAISEAAAGASPVMTNPTNASISPSGSTNPSILIPEDNVKKYATKRKDASSSAHPAGSAHLKPDSCVSGTKVSPLNTDRKAKSNPIRKVEKRPPTDRDVLCGRGNICHPGNRLFRDLINLHRYLLQQRHVRRPIKHQKQLKDGGSENSETPNQNDFIESGFNVVEGSVNSVDEDEETSQNSSSSVMKYKKRHAAIAKSIVRAIRSCCEEDSLVPPGNENDDESSDRNADDRSIGGRFLKKDLATNCWYDIGDAQAKEKVRQALREKAGLARAYAFGKKQEISSVDDDESRLEEDEVILYSPDFCDEFTSGNKRDEEDTATISSSSSAMISRSSSLQSLTDYTVFNHNNEKDDENCISIRENDVIIFGHEKNSRDSGSNNLYDHLINHYQKEYEKAGPLEKAKIALTIVKAIRKAKNHWTNDSSEDKDANCKSIFNMEDDTTNEKTQKTLKGRFLAKSNKTGKWYDVGDICAAEWTIKTLWEHCRKLSNRTNAKAEQSMAQNSSDSSNELGFESEELAKLTTKSSLSPPKISQIKKTGLPTTNSINTMIGRKNCLIASKDGTMLSCSLPNEPVCSNFFMKNDQPPLKRDYVTEVTEADVLFGRGGLTNNHKGNVRFRDLVALHRPDYVKAIKIHKPAVARLVVEAIRKSTPPGRFLKRDRKNGGWYDVGDRHAAEKASQALREKIQEERHIVKKEDSGNEESLIDSKGDKKLCEANEQQYSVEQQQQFKVLEWAQQHSSLRRHSMGVVGTISKAHLDMSQNMKRKLDNVAAPSALNRDNLIHAKQPRISYAGELIAGIKLSEKLGDNITQNHLKNEMVYKNLPHIMQSVPNPFFFNILQNQTGAEAFRLKPGNKQIGTDSISSKTILNTPISSPDQVMVNNIPLSSNSINAIHGDVRRGSFPPAFGMARMKHITLAKSSESKVSPISGNHKKVQEPKPVKPDSITSTNAVKNLENLEEVNNTNIPENNKMAPIKNTDEEGEIVVTNYDILCGRGGLTNHHIGNKRFRDFVSFNRPDYVRAPKIHKPAVARLIVNAIRTGNPPGRFLKKDEKTGKWYDIGDKRAAEKASQALREKPPEERNNHQGKLQVSSCTNLNFPKLAKKPEMSL